MNRIKKVFAVAASLALVGTTMVGALADLGDYPAPFVDDGVFNGAIVVGANAATSDVLGAIDIAASLQADAKEGTPIAGSTGVTVEGGEDFDDLYVNSSTTYNARLDDNDLEGFVDSDFEYDDTDYDYEDYIGLAVDAIRFEGSQYDEDFGNGIYGVIEDPSDVEYVVEIDADFNFSDFDADDEEFEIKFLGRTLTITGADNDEITLESSSEFYMEEGDMVTVDSHDITLKKVGSNAVLVDVDGQTLSVGDDESEEFDEADDFEVEVKSMFYIEGATDNSATLKLGTSISDTVTDGDSLELFGEPSDEDEADWLWHIAMVGPSGVSEIGAILNIDRTGLDADEADERNALAVGEAIDLPNNYASIEYSSIAVTSFTDLTIEIDDDWDVKDENGAELVNAWGMKFTTDSGDDDFVVNGGLDTDEVWVLYGGNSSVQIWYTDGDDEANATTDVAVNTFDLKIDDESWTITPGNATGMDLDIAVPAATSGETLTLDVVSGNDYFGASDDDETTELLYGATGIGSADYDGGYFMMDYGAYFENPEDQFGSGNKFTISIPSERQYATVVVKAKGSVVSAGAEGGMSYTVNPIALGLGMLDTDAVVGSKPMIIVGGPAANTAAAEVMGNPTPDVIAETFSDGKAIIKWYEDDQAMLVAGYEAQETLGAAYVVARYGDYDFAGEELEVVVTSLDNIDVNPVE